MQCVQNLHGKAYLNYLCHPNEYIRKNQEPDWLDRTNEPIDLFKFIKSKLKEIPMMAFLQLHRPYMISFDAPAYTTGAAHLQQENTRNLKDSYY